MSVLALASVLSLALLRSFGPGASPIIDVIEEESPGLSDLQTTSVSTTTGKAFSIWDHLPILPAATITAVETTSVAPIATHLIPDLQLIKQALSSFSTNSDKVAAPDPAITKSGAIGETVESSTHPRHKRRQAMSSTTCCSLSTRDSQVALTTVTTALSTANSSWPKTLRQRIMRGPTNTTIVNVRASTPSCPCSLSQHVRSEMMSRIGLTFGPMAQYAASASRYLDRFYAPALAELQKELGELLEMARTIAKTTSTLSQLLVNRAVRGVVVSRAALNSATSRLRQHLPTPAVSRKITNTTAEHTVIQEAIAVTRANIDNLSDYVESQATALSEFVEEHTIIMQEKGMESLKQAKKGLDKLIAEAKKITRDPVEEKITSTDVSKRGPMPFWGTGMRADRPPLSRSSRLHRRHHSKRTERRPKGSFPPPEIPSRGRRFLDMVHHVGGS